MASMWSEKLRSAQKTCIIQDGRRKIHFTFEDGTELAEEYDVRTSELQIRKWRRKGSLGAAGKWDFEVGEQLAQGNLENDGLMESSNNPIFVRKDNNVAFQWRVRNLPYPLETYSVTTDADSHILTIRTTNKKYFKKFNVPDMERAQLSLQQDQVSLAHANNTLIITYKKPQQILKMEKVLQEEFMKLKASKDGDVDCTPS